MSASKRKGQYIFLLKDIDYLRLIKETYYPQTKAVSPPLSRHGTTSLDQTTLPIDKPDSIYSFYDPDKNKINLLITMCDHIENKTLPLITDKPCHWCGYNFQTAPIGCPLRYLPDDINNQTFLRYLQERNMDSSTTDLFETEGLFCSFPCCKAYIMDNRFSNKYKRSISLLYLLYFKVYGVRMNIPRAPHWKLLERWCGSMTIEEYRNSFCRLVYNISPNIKRPFMYTTGTYVEELKAQ